MARIIMQNVALQFPANVSQPPTTTTNNNITTTATSSTDQQFDYSSVTVTALVIFSALFFLGFFSIFARRFFATGQGNFHGATTSSIVSRFTSSSSSSVPPGLDPTAIKTLPLLPYDTKKRIRSYGGSEAGCDCVVCLTMFGDGEVVKAIPCCGHLFHPQCIDSWLVTHASCPLCRSTELFKSMEERPISDRGDFGSGTPQDVGEDRHQPDDERGGIGGIGRSQSWYCLTVREGERNNSTNVDGGGELSRTSCSF